MAKINSTTQDIQENLSALANLGILMCMVVTIVGIKLWWFKHRLSFEESCTHNNTGSRATPAVIVPRRSKQQRYKKDKRYSQQIYDNVEVHGVFRQKSEDDLEIQRPQLLPPIRGRQFSDTTSSLILPPPPHTKKRDQIHSTAFEDLEITTHSLTTASSSDLTETSEINTKITLTFKEFEKQFKLKEIKFKDDAEAPINQPNNEVIVVPVPPLRLNRSSSAMTKPERSQRILKATQSITLPEFHGKVIEKRPSGFSSPKEDLTKIDDYDQPKIFQNLGDRKPIGYMQEEYERELNSEVEENKDICESPGVAPALKALRNECIVYNNDLDESPDFQSTKEYNFSKKSNEWEDSYHKKNDLNNHKLQSQETLSAKFAKSNSINSEHTKEVLLPTDHETLKDWESSKLMKDTKNLEEENSQKGMKLGESYEKELKPAHSAETKSLEKVFVTDWRLTSARAQDSQAVGKQILTTTKHEVQKRSFNKENSKEFFKETMTDIVPNDKITEIFDSLSFEEEFDNQFDSWPQFDEKIETPKVNVRRFSSQNLEAQNSFEEDQLKTTGKKATGSLTPPEFEHIQKRQEDCSNKFYSQIRSFMTTEPSKFDSAETQNYVSEDQNNSAIRERRPTGFINENEYYVTFSDESDDDCEQNVEAKRENSAGGVCSNVEIVEIHSRSVNFADSDYSPCPENVIEKFTLNQRRSTGISTALNTEGSGNNIEYQDDSKIQVKFAENTDFKDEQEIWNSKIKTRRPTGYIKQLEIMDLSDDETAINKQTQSSNNKFSSEYGVNTNNNLENSDIFKDGNKIESLLKERRPTGYVRKEEFHHLEKQVSFQLNNIDNDGGSTNNEALNQRRPTGFIRKYEVTKNVNFQLNHEDDKTRYGNEQLKQRRPTGFVRRNQLKCLDQTAPIFHPSNADNNNDFDNHLWQEIEKDVKKDVSSNFEEEFVKIRHSYELNEADFLEPRDELQKSPTNSPQEPLGFGKSIDDDWENFEKLKSKVIIKPLQSPQAIQITFSDAELAATTSILKECKSVEEPKPRKSKVTFDFKTDERVIPARNQNNSLEENSYYKPSQPIPPQPMQRVTTINYNTEMSVSPIVNKPKEISLFGTQTSQEDNDFEDSWSAIRKHRNLTKEFENFSVDSKSPTPQQTDFKMPPKPSYRNPLAQLAIQRGKDVRADMDGFKSRSINDRKPETTKRQRHQLLNLSNNDYESTEA